jgi:hypothetical protein
LARRRVHSSVGDAACCWFVAEAEGVEPVRAMCAEVQLPEAVRLVLTAVRVQRPWVSAAAWCFHCRRLDAPGSEPLVYRIRRRVAGRAAAIPGFPGFAVGWGTA